MSINNVVISGNLTRDPEMRQSNSGTVILNFSVAVNDRRKNQQSGEWEDYANYIDCTMFGTRAQAVSPYLHKGTRIVVTGKLHWQQWERDGQKRSKVSVNVDDVVLMQARRDDQSAPAMQNGYYAAPTQEAPRQAQTASYVAPNFQPVNEPVAQAEQPVSQPTIYDEDIPF